MQTHFTYLAFISHYLWSHVSCIISFKIDHLFFTLWFQINFSFCFFFFCFHEMSRTFIQLSFFDQELLFATRLSPMTEKTTSSGFWRPTVLIYGVGWRHHQILLHLLHQLPKIKVLISLQAPLQASLLQWIFQVVSLDFQGFILNHSCYYLSSSFDFSYYFKLTRKELYF